MTDEEGLPPDQQGAPPEDMQIFAKTLTGKTFAITIETDAYASIHIGAVPAARVWPTAPPTPAPSPAAGNGTSADASGLSDDSAYASTSASTYASSIPTPCSDAPVDESPGASSNVGTKRQRRRQRRHQRLRQLEVTAAPTFDISVGDVTDDGLPPDHPFGAPLSDCNIQNSQKAATQADTAEVELADIHTTSEHDIKKISVSDDNIEEHEDGRAFSNDNNTLSDGTLLEYDGRTLSDYNIQKNEFRGNAIENITAHIDVSPKLDHTLSGYSIQKHIESEALTFERKSHDDGRTFSSENIPEGSAAHVDPALGSDGSRPWIRRVPAPGEPDGFPPMDPLVPAHGPEVHGCRGPEVHGPSLSSTHAEMVRVTLDLLQLRVESHDMLHTEAARICSGLGEYLSTYVCAEADSIKRRIATEFTFSQIEAPSFDEPQ